MLTSVESAQNCLWDKVLLQKPIFSKISRFLSASDIKALALVAKRYYDHFFITLESITLTSRHIQAWGGFTFSERVKGLHIKLDLMSELRVFDPKTEHQSMCPTDFAISEENANRIHTLSLDNITQLYKVKKALGEDLYKKIRVIKFPQRFRSEDDRGVYDDAYFEGKKIELCDYNVRNGVLDLIKRTKSVKINYGVKSNPFSAEELRVCNDWDNANQKKLVGLTLKIEDRLRVRDGFIHMDKEKDKVCFKDMKHLRIHWTVEREGNVGTLPELNADCKLDIFVTQAHQETAFKQLVVFLGESNLKKINKLNLEFRPQVNSKCLFTHLNNFAFEEYSAVFQNVKKLVISMVNIYYFSNNNLIMFPKLEKCESITLRYTGCAQLQYLMPLIHIEDWHKVRKLVLNNIYHEKGHFDLKGSRALLENVKAIKFIIFSFNEFTKKLLMLDSLPPRITFFSKHVFGDWINFYSLQDVVSMPQIFIREVKGMMIESLVQSDLKQENLSSLAHVELLYIGSIEEAVLQNNKDELQKLLSSNRLNYIQLNSPSTLKGIEYLQSLKASLGPIYPKVKRIQLNCSDPYAFLELLHHSNLMEPHKDLFDSLEQLDILIQGYAYTGFEHWHRSRRGDWVKAPG